MDEYAMATASIQDLFRPRAGLSCGVRAADCPGQGAAGEDLGQVGAVRGAGVLVAE
jgi:hypothetical protein